MKKFSLIAALSVMTLGAALAVVVRPAPFINWIDSSGKSQSTAAFKDQPLIILIAPSPRDWSFRAQVGQLQKMYERYAAQKVVFVAAFTQEGGRIRSNIPFALAADGPRVAYDFQTGEKFACAIIGRDGNLDYVTNRVVPAQRIYDILDASFVSQQNLRRP